MESIPLNGQVYAREAVIENGPHDASYLVTLKVRKTGPSGVRNHQYKMVMYR